MIHCDDSYINVFRTIPSTPDIAGHIKGILITVDGYPVSTSAVIPSCTINTITVDPAGCSFSLTVNIPIMDIAEDIIVGNSGKYTSVRDNCAVDIVIDYDAPLTLGTFDIYADVWLKSILIIPHKKVSILGQAPHTGISLNSGYNVSVSYSGEDLSITGGPGLGKGRYKGSEDPNTAEKYRGIKSINGVRAGRNVNIHMSDLLTQHGARVE